MSNHNRRSKLLLVALLVMVVGLLLPASPVVADGNCDAGDYCFADVYNLWHTRETDPGPNWSYFWEYYPSPWDDVWMDDTASSVKNNGRSQNVKVYRYEGYGTLLRCLALGTFQNWSSGTLGDKASSHHWTSSSSGCV